MKNIFHLLEKSGRLKILFFVAANECKKTAGEINDADFTRGARFEFMAVIGVQQEQISWFICKIILIYNMPATPFQHINQFKTVVTM